MSDRIRREERVGQEGCTRETVSRMGRLFKFNRFNLIEATHRGYEKSLKLTTSSGGSFTPPEFFDAALPEGVTGSNGQKDFENRRVIER